MKLQGIKTIVKEELSRFEKLPAWIEPMLQTLNTFISNVTIALRNSLTFEDNFLCKVKKVTLEHGVESEINPDTRFKVMGVLFLSAEGLLIDKFGWRQLSSGNIGVTVHFASGTDALCEIVILLR
jgi:hypothetical protein